MYDVIIMISAAMYFNNNIYIKNFIFHTIIYLCYTKKYNTPRMLIFFFFYESRIYFDKTIF